MSTTTTTPPPAGAAPTSSAPTAGRSVNLNAILVEGRALIALILIIAIFALLSDNYLTAGNLTTITKQVALNAIVALGMLHRRRRAISSRVGLEPCPARPEK